MCNNRLTKIVSIIFLYMISTILCADDTQYYIFTGSSNRKLAEDVAHNLRVPLGNAKVDRYKDGEINIKIYDNVKNKNVIIIQSMCKSVNASVNDSIMELYLMARTMKRAAAKSITAIIPYFGYARQDRKRFTGTPISASDLAMMLEVSGIDRIAAIDIHAEQIQGFFHNVPVDIIYPSTIMASYFKDLKTPVLISVHSHSLDRVKRFRAQLLKQGISSKLALMYKQLSISGRIKKMDLIGNVKNSDVIIVEDMSDSGSTLSRSANILKEAGANEVYAIVTHPVFSDNAIDQIATSNCKEIIITDTIPIRSKLPKNMKQVSIAPLIAEYIKQLYADVPSIDTL